MKNNKNKKKEKFIYILSDERERFFIQLEE
jgi:hypothetical protein